LIVEPHPRYEEWTVFGPGGMVIVSAPGGGHAVSSHLATPSTAWQGM
jgi:hypothetical protein